LVEKNTNSMPSLFPVQLWLIDKLVLEPSYAMDEGSLAVAERT
jgi:hypothetical protein